MAITNYGELKTAIASWLARSDLTANIPDFIALAESRINFGGDMVDPLRIRAMETAADLTFSSASAALPTDYLSMRRVYLDSNPKRYLEQVTPEYYYSTYVGTNTGIPKTYIIEGENILVGPAPNGSYTGKMLYYKKFDALSGDSDTNWLLTNAPSVYLYGALIEAAPFIHDDPRTQFWGDLFRRAVKGIQDSDKRDRWSGSTLRARSAGGAP